MVCVGMAQMSLNLLRRPRKKHLKHVMLSVALEVVVLHLHTVRIGLLVCFIAMDHIHMEAVNRATDVTYCLQVNCFRVPIYFFRHVSFNITPTALTFQIYSAFG